MIHKADSVLAHIRTLDLTDVRGLLCGKILADLGCDVVKVEPPGGDLSRGRGPFFQNMPHVERSLYWWAFNTNKRGISLDLKSSEGQETFKNLIRTADFVIESFPPGHLEDLGLGYRIMQQINPGVILVSITPYGQTGPYKDFKASDLTQMAMSGQMSVSGDLDRPPVRVSVPQAYLHGGINAAAACLIALHYRGKTGLGQQVDISIHESVVRTLGLELAQRYYAGEVCYRYGPCRPRNDLLIRDVWPCKDGHITLKLMGGFRLSELRPLIEWMIREKKAGSLKDVDWGNLAILGMYSREVMEWQDTFGRFLQEHTVSEIMELALSARLPIMPNNSPANVAHDEQLAARHFWVNVEHAEIGHAVVYPRAPYLFSESRWHIHSRAPHIGEHNQEVTAELEASPIVSEDSHSQKYKPNQLDGLYKSALGGIKIADFSWVLTGPLAVKYLVSFGAEAIRIESGTRLDNVREGPPFKDNIRGLNRSGLFQMVNAGKRSLAINLADPRGKGVARRVVAWADVVAESFTPGTMDKLGLGYQDIKNIKPDIIMLSASIQGNSGPHYLQPGYGWNLTGLAGFNYLTGWPDRAPVSPHNAYTDWIAPVYGAIAVLAALDYRRHTGKGQHIDLSQFETGVNFLITAMLDYTVNGNSQVRRGNRSNRAAPHNAYRCMGFEQWCTIAVSSETEWQNLCRLMGNPEWSSENRFNTLARRKDNEDELDTLVSAWTIILSAEELMMRLQYAGVPAGIVQTNKDLLEKDPQLRDRGFFQYADHPEIGRALIPREPILMDKTRQQCCRAPTLGEDSQYVCERILKMSREEFDELKLAGVLQ